MYPETQDLEPLHPCPPHCPYAGLWAAAALIRVASVIDLNNIFGEDGNLSDGILRKKTKRFGYEKVYQVDKTLNQHLYKAMSGE